MNDVDPRTELFREGLKSYLDVKQAVRAFENLIGEIAKKVVSVHLDEVKSISTVRDQHIYTDVFDPEPSRVAVGALVVAQEAGVRCGVRWDSSKHHMSRGLMGCVSVRIATRTRRDNLHRALLRHQQDTTVRVEIAPPSPWEVHVVVPLQEDVSLEQLEEGLEIALTTFLILTTKAGGLQAAIDGVANMP